MKNALVLVVTVLVGVAASVRADDGQVPQATLRALGLSNMQKVSDAEGMRVRGMSSGFVAVRGTSLIFGQLLTPDTKNFVVASSVNEVDAVGETTNVGVLSASKEHEVTLNLSLTVTFPDSSAFTGAITGLAGGEGFVFASTP